MAKLSKNKNFDTYPVVSKMMDMFDEFSKLDVSSLQSLQSFASAQNIFIDSLKNVDYFSKPIYEWKVTQLTDQTYEAVKV